MIGTWGEDVSLLICCCPCCRMTTTHRLPTVPRCCNLMDTTIRCWSLVPWVWLAWQERFEFSPFFTHFLCFFKRDIQKLKIFLAHFVSYNFHTFQTNRDYKTLPVSLAQLPWHRRWPGWCWHRCLVGEDHIRWNPVILIGIYPIYYVSNPHFWWFSSNEAQKWILTISCFNFGVLELFLQCFSPSGGPFLWSPCFFHSTSSQDSHPTERAHEVIRKNNATLSEKMFAPVTGLHWEEGLAMQNVPHWPGTQICFHYWGL